MQPQEPKHSQPEPAISSAPISSSSKSSKKVQTLTIICVALGLAAIILLILVFVFSTKSSTTQQNLEDQYKAGVDAGSKAQQTTDVKAFQDQQSSDSRIYKAPTEAGAFEVSIPKSWSWVITPGGSNGEFSGTANPDYVDTTVAQQGFSVKIVNQHYSDAKQEYDAKAKSSGGTLVAAPITVSGIEGMSYKGNVGNLDVKVNSEVVILPVREKTMIFRSDDIERFGTTFDKILANAKIRP